MSRQPDDSEPAGILWGELRKRMMDARAEGAAEARRAMIQCSGCLPEERLAAMLSDYFKANIPPAKLYDFIRAHWSEVRKLAHQIHGV